MTRCHSSYDAGHQTNSVMRPSLEIFLEKGSIKKTTRNQEESTKTKQKKGIAARQKKKTQTQTPREKSVAQPKTTVPQVKEDAYKKELI